MFLQISKYKVITAPETLMFQGLLVFVNYSFWINVSVIFAELMEAILENCG